ncbi:peptidoglycan recognition protein family protein [Nocardiopsis baichengensis]|uniref:peptidoglycan recognition protein family protein n=1 Tax=Nocardiopsis baichengensis TaxID=280240 RepID=UPI000476301F|nr:peptidoglycan-binding domain-containing protein [Nocardiopsis baichengensis]
MVHIIGRSQWGARSPRSRATTDWSRRTEFTVHYSAGPPTQSVRSIQDFHMDGNGWADIGYNFLVDRDGTVYEGRGWMVVGAHAAPRNTQGIGVCFIGRDGDATPKAEAAIRALYEEANRRAGRVLARKGHRDINSTSCPGDQLYAWIRAGMDAAEGAEAGDGGGGAQAAPAFPLPRGWYFGPRSGPVSSVSGYFSHRSGLRRWQRRMAERGWSIAADGLYGSRTAGVARAFQAEKGLSVDGLIGPRTWSAAWTEPVT